LINQELKTLQSGPEKEKVIKNSLKAGYTSSLVIIVEVTIE